jgi:phosphohistidine phosphatase
MKRLILVRHAKSAWGDPTLDDHDRPLNQRGRLAAPLMGAWLVDNGYRPDAILCSSSERTRETVARMRPCLDADPSTLYVPELYHACPSAMLDIVRTAPTDAATAAVIGHQPGISAFARKLANADTPAGCARAFQKYPTCACAVFEFAVDDWTAVAFNGGAFVAFAVPRELV